MSATAQYFPVMLIGGPSCGETVNWDDQFDTMIVVDKRGNDHLYHLETETTATHFTILTNTNRDNQTNQQE